MTVARLLAIGKAMAARIYQRIKNNMQSGRAQTDRWILEFDDPEFVRADPLTGWAGSGRTQAQVKLSFPTKEAAVAYAERNGLDFTVVETPPRRLKIQAYADNFR